MGERVAGKVAMVFGGGQTPGETIGNGRATALVLAAEGATVVAVDRDLASAEETAAMIAEKGGAASAMAADVMDEDEVRAAIEAVVRDFGRIDILHNNIGASLALGDAPATDLEAEAFDRLVAVNLRGMWFACKHAIPVMREQGGGSIVNISSMAVRSP
ncbi:MAG: SDR family NAD(P)-dependent oxidoreductase, partial [Dehalococcoidia bacterium]